jgi:hypothetical protein
MYLTDILSVCVCVCMYVCVCVWCGVCVAGWGGGEIRYGAAIACCEDPNKNVGFRVAELRRAQERHLRGRGAVGINIFHFPFTNNV